MRPATALFRSAASRAFRPLGLLFTVPADDPQLIRSQFAAFTRQVPLLYLILVVNTALVAATHLRSAPPLLAIVFPAVLCGLCLGRTATWVRSRGQELGPEQIARRMRLTMRLVVLLGAAFAAWGLSLYPYGDAYARCHVAFFMALTVMSCIFCLMHLRAAALLLTAVVIVPFAAFFALTGQPVLVAIAANTALVAAGMVVILLTHYRDFARMVHQQAALQRLSDENVRLANIDSLTGLANRRRFLADLHALLDRAGRSGARCAVGLLDLDGFKPVNDVYGHATGDRVLVEVSRRLGALGSPSVSFARLGGDEFGLLIDADLSEPQLLELGRAVCRALEAPFVLPAATAELTGSLGFACFPDAAPTADALFERADYALYHAKQHCRGGAVVFSREHEQEIRDAGIIEQELRQADLARDMRLAFQPIHDAAAGRTVGFEALARWNSPTRGPVRPDVFIAAAERSDLISRLTEALLPQALAAAATWPAELSVSFNLSTRDLTSPDVMRRIGALIAASGVAPSRINFEVTETALMRDFDQAREALLALKRLGAGISLDDFGTGYSSLNYVRRLPIDRIKIDRSFITDIEADGGSRSIVKTVVDLCGNLGLDCVVEGVETKMQASILRDLGCCVMQGYLFGRPMEGCAAARHAVEGLREAAPQIA